MNSKSRQICRLCLETSDGLVNIFEKFHDSTIASVLAKHFWFQIHKDDGMPEWVCEICWIQTKTFHHFYKRLEFRHKNCMNSIVLVKVDEIKQERSVSPMEEALEADLNIVKCEEEKVMTMTTDDTQTPIKDNSSDEDNNDNSSDQNEDEETTEEEDKLSFDKPNRIISHSRSEIEKQDAEIRKFFRMKCEICSDVELDTLKRARKHYRQVHKTSGYLICCERKFKFRYRMLDHIRYHVNPDAHRCEKCGKSFKDKHRLKIHEKIHIPLNLRGQKCSLCSKICTTAKSLKYHVQHKHPTDSSEKFPCDQCDKIFQSKMSLTCHIRNVHDSSLDHVCEICGRTFKGKVSLQNHKEIEHSTTPPPKVQCDICGTWLKHERNLWHHFKMHQEMQEAQDGISQAANCPICKKKVKSKRSLASHIKCAHGERNHKCTFCDKAFRTSQGIKEHIAALHTGADLYSCAYCDRTFKSNANMYNHRKKAHLAEWTRDKAEKDRCNQVAPNETETTATMKIYNDDGMPEWVCEICWIQTKTFHHFYKRIQFRHSNFMNSIVLVKADEIKEERTASPTEEALEADLNMVKCEEETNIRLEATDTHTLVKAELSWGDDSNDRINRKIDCRPTSDDEDELCVEILKIDNITEKTDKLERHEKERQDAEIRRFFTMKCDICSDVEFDTLKKVRKHYRQVHKTKGYLVCCGNNYGKRCGMLDHIQYHVNPDAHRCDQCGKSYRNRKILREHMKCHVRAHKCSICSSSFPSAAILKNHVRDTHSTDTSEKFPCDQV